MSNRTGEELIIVGETEYFGRNPQFTEITDPNTGRKVMVRTAKGIPFIKLN